MAAVLGTDFFEKCYTPLGEVMDLVALVNCTVNFLLYSLMSRQFRITFRKTFHLREARKGSDASLARDKKGSPSQLPPKAEYSMVRRLERSWTYYILKSSIIHFIHIYLAPSRYCENTVINILCHIYTVWYIKSFMLRFLYRECSREKVTEQTQPASRLNRPCYKNTRYQAGCCSKNLFKSFLWCSCDKLSRRKRCCDQRSLNPESIYENKHFNVPAAMKNDPSCILNRKIWNTICKKCFARCDGELDGWILKILTCQGLNLPDKNVV